MIFIKILTYIISQLGSNYSMSEIAKSTNVSVATVMRLFDKEPIFLN